MQRNLRSSAQPSGRREVLVALCLFVLLVGVYWFTYSGLLISTDESALFDATQGLVRRGNLEVTYTLYQRTIFSYSLGKQPDTPLVDAEPMQLVMAAPLFLIAEHMPGVGMMHAVWLLNVLVCAASGAVFFLYARSLGYRESVSIAGTILYGLGTIVWPYSKVFFREPLAMLLLFSAALCLNSWRERWRAFSGLPWLIGFVLLYAMGLLTKEAAMIALPMYVVLVIPRLSGRINWRRLAGIVLILGLALLVIGVLLYIVLQFLSVTRDYNPFIRLASIRNKSSFMSYALRSYLFSPGRSLFAFSPLLVLGIPGIWILARRQRYREAILPVVAVMSFVIGYAVVRHENWFAGLSWGPRYLVPVTPFAMLAVLPVLDAGMSGAGSRLARCGGGALFLFSVWTQLTGVLIRQTAYFDELNRRGVIAWQEGAWQFSQSPMLVNPPLLGKQPLDFAWIRAIGAGYWQPASAVLLVVGACMALWFSMRHPQASRRILGLGIVMAVLSISAAFYVGLRSIYHDPGYMGDVGRLHDLFDMLYEHIQPDDIVVLASPDYQNYVYNYYRLDSLLYILHYAPGEQPSPEQLPQVTNTNPDMLVEPRYAIFLNFLSEYTGRVWVLSNSGPFISYSVRPVEWYMVRHYFPLQTLQTDETARLILFDVNSDAPPDQAMQWPGSLVDAWFGDSVEMIGYDLPPARLRTGPHKGPDPLREGYRPGDVVPISLLWRAADTPALDYNVGVFVLDASGRVAAQQNSAPQGGFMPMNTWRSGQYIRDNHGLQLPSDLPAGTYDIWVKVYAWQTQEPLPVQGQDRVDDGEAALLTSIQIAP